MLHFLQGAVVSGVFITVVSANSFLHCSLQAMRDYTEVDERTITLPWCLSVTALGHSFPPDAEHFVPTLSFSSRNLVFPCATAGQPVHRTLAVRNDGDTPVMFNFDQDSSGFV